MSADARIGYRPTWAEINLDNLAFNFHQIKRLVSPQTKVLVTVKADAYGHGLIPVSKKLVECGVDFLGVASIDEGIKLREAGIKKSVLVLGAVLNEDIEPLFEYGLTPSVCTEDLGLALSKKGKRLKKRIKVHIKIDTGMGRIGVLHQDALKLIKAVHKMEAVEIEGLFTHFAFADLDKEFTGYQMRLFNNLVTSLRKSDISIPLHHSANSMGVLNFKESHFNMVRPGIICYGLRPVKELPIKIKPVLSLKTRVVYTKRVPKDFGLSYGHAYVTKKATTVVTLPVGYGDGYPRQLSNIATVLIGGKTYKISGRICMDQVLVDVGDAKVKVGDEVVLIGTQGKQEVTSEMLAALCGTIPYEIVCGLGSRIPRVYV
ncbi:MAG: alanine racemase [Deltaproteobacteria bacterium]